MAATVLLGVNQGLCWSMTQTAKMDITRADERGLTMGLNEFSGYLGVAVAGIATGYLAMGLGPRLGLFLFGTIVIALALLLSLTSIRETHPWAKVEGGQTRSTAEVFALMSWRDRRMAAFCQAGLVEKFVDALVWLFYPVFLYQKGLDLAGIGWVAGIYGFVWGGSQFLTGKLSDHIGRLRPIIWGMWLCGGGVALTLLGSDIYWWSFSAAVTGFGMALLYPNLSAAVADLADASWRSSAIGIYRFWRDIGYGIGALALGLVAQLGNAVAAGFLVCGGRDVCLGTDCHGVGGRRPIPGCGESGNRESQRHHSRTVPLAQDVAQVILDQSIVQVGWLPHESYQLL